MASSLVKNNEDVEGKSGYGCLYVKVSMDGAPYLRKVDLKTYSNYLELSSALEKMFSCFTIGTLSPSLPPSPPSFLSLSLHTQPSPQLVGFVGKISIKSYLLNFGKVQKREMLYS
jgi:hypothetical protein